MKKNIPGLVFIAMLLMAVIGCGRHHDRGREINNFAVDETIKSGDAVFEMTTADGTSFVGRLSIEVQWPEKLGDHSIGALQDTIKAWLFEYGTVSYAASVRKGNIEKTMKRFLTGECFLDTDSMTSRRIENPAASGDSDLDWYVNKTARIRELNQRYITFEISEESYVGGAHPFDMKRPFTYSLEEAKVLSLDDIILPTAHEKVAALVRASLVDDLNVPESRLARKGIDLEAVDQLGLVYLLDGQVVVFYDYYVIAPYYMGSFSITLDPSELNGCLTPTATELLR